MMDTGKSVVTSIRLGEKLIKRLKKQALKNGYGEQYQPMVRDIIEMASYNQLCPENSVKTQLK